MDKIYKLHILIFQFDIRYLLGDLKVILIILYIKWNIRFLYVCSIIFYNTSKINDYITYMSYVYNLQFAI